MRTEVHFYKKYGYLSGNLPVSFSIWFSCRIPDWSLIFSAPFIVVSEYFPSLFTSQTTSDHHEILTTDTSHHLLHTGIFSFTWEGLDLCRQASEFAIVHFRWRISYSSNLHPTPLLLASPSYCQKSVNTNLIPGCYCFEFIRNFNGKFLFLTRSINLTVRNDIWMCIWLLHKIVNLLVYSDHVENVSDENNPTGPTFRPRIVTSP